ncbi:MAG TPA: ATP-binding cassette domain-containing protein [Chloroflexi bacterium]|nr:ATP-binding cassette domain-containing protein [Chloroflexota bacterium]
MCVGRGRTDFIGHQLDIPNGKIHAILGPNGGGKTSLVMTRMGFRKYVVASGAFFPLRGHTNLGVW